MKPILTFASAVMLILTAQSALAEHTVNITAKSSDLYSPGSGDQLVAIINVVLVDPDHEVDTICTKPTHSKLSKDHSGLPGGHVERIIVSNLSYRPPNEFTTDDVCITRDEAIAGVPWYFYKTTTTDASDGVTFTQEYKFLAYKKTK